MKVAEYAALKDENTFEVFSFFQLSAITANSCTVFVMSFKRKNDVTPSNVMTDVISAVTNDVS